MNEMYEQPNLLRILIADDVRSTAQSIRLMLRLLPDVEVVANAGDGRQAIEMANTYRPDIALVDINMPALDGLSAVRKMLENRPEMVCIIMSVEGDDVALQEAKASGASDYLIKPFTTEELVAVVERAGRLIMNRRPESKGTGLLRRKLTAPLRLGRTSQLREPRETQLKQLAAAYIKARRTDDEAITVLEELAASTYCELHWVKWLAMIYVKRSQWENLRILAERMESKVSDY